MRELRVEDALLYLDQVKVEFGDRPHIYNEFLEIMKTFKTQQIDTPGVIRRVSNLFKGNRRLVLGFNTFLPEGYQIELPSDGNGPPVAVYRAPGSNVAQILREGDTPQIPPVVQQKPLAQPPQQGHPSLVSHAQPPLHQPPHGHSPAMRQSHGQHHLQLPHAARMHQAGEAFAQNLVPQVMASHVPSQAMLQRDRQQHPLDQRQLPTAGIIRPNQGSTVPPAQQSPIAQVAGHEGKQPAVGLADGIPANNGVGGGVRQAKGTQQPQAAAGGAQPEQGPMEFDHAINYVTTIKKRFATEPEIYKKFLEILHTYQKEQRGIKDVLDEVSKLFADHPDLLKEFTYFLPDAVQGQAKAQLDQVAKESEARKRAQAKHAILSTAHGMQKQAQSAPRSRQPEYDRDTVHVPYGAVRGRTEEQEQMIIRGAHFGVVSFDAVRPPRRDDLAPSKAATKAARPVAIPPIPKQPNTAEAAFLQKTKKHLERRELRSDKPIGSRRHTPYVEFLKCLHLFGAGILSRDELIMLLKSLFMYGHAPKSGTSSSTGVTSAITSDANDLIRDLEEIMVGRGQYAVQQSALKDKSKYGSLRTFDFDLSNCEKHTPSYFSYPSDYPHGLLISHPGQTKWDKQALNDVVMCIGDANGERRIHSIEAYDGIAERHNAYEEAMMRIEEERYEIDMAIERNVQALRQIEPLAEEVQALKEQEEKDGQPIGRLQYRLNRHTLNSVHTNAIARLYGERGDEVLQHLLRNPLAVLPIVYQRLKQKDAEWRKVKADLSAKLNASTAANYEGTLDTQCYFKRKALERLGTVSRLRDDCIRARSHARSGEKNDQNATVAKFLPNFAAAHLDSQAMLFQSYTSVKSQLDISHRDVLSLVSKRIQLDSNLSAIHRERIGRIWAEFVVPWFDYPVFWVVDVLRNSFSGSLSPNIVKFAPGQRVVTIYGEGTILAFIKTNDDNSPKYRVKLPYGYGFLNPAAILFAIASPDTPFVRRDGVMVRDEAIATELTSEGQLGDRYKLVFGTENMYIFLRQFSLLCSLLRETRQCCENSSSPVDPSMMYHDPFKRDENIDASSKRLDFSCIIDGLKKVVGGKMDAKELEAIARKVSKETVHQVAAMPKFVERCAAALIETAKEDAILHLYDYCHLPRVDPASARAHCFAIAANASYRIQYDKTSGELYFCFVPKGTALLASLPDDIKSMSEDERMSDAENGVSPMDDDEEDDPVEEYEDDQPAWKRLKVR